jgi:hypothetical protein
MAKKLATRGSQKPQVATFEFEVTDTMVNTSGVEQAFSAAAGVFDVINLPVNAQVIGGDVTVVTVSNDTGTATLAIGDASSATRYLAATTIKTAARTALTLTGYEHATGENIRFTLANASGNATAGKVRVTVQYIVRNRMDEVQTH